MNVDDYAKSARFSLTENEREFITKQFEMFNFAELDKINTDNIQPLFTVLDEKNVFREDVAKKYDSREVLLNSSPEQYGGYFQIPKALD